MKAFILDRYGSGVALRASEMADPEVGERDVLVHIHAAGVNLFDSKLVDKVFPFPSTNEALATSKPDEQEARS